MQTLTIDAGIKAWYPLARAYKWTLSFLDYPGQFPVSMASDTWMQIVNGKVDYVPGGYSYPEQATRGDFSLTIFEIKDHGMRTWLETWIREISEDGTTVALLAAAAREVYLFPLDLDNSIVRRVSLVVIPDGTITYEYSSDMNSIISASLALVVVGGSIGE